MFSTSLFENSFEALTCCDEGQTWTSKSTGSHRANLWLQPTGSRPSLPGPPSYNDSYHPTCNWTQLTSVRRLQEVKRRPPDWGPWDTRNDLAGSPSRVSRFPSCLPDFPDRVSQRHPTPNCTQAQTHKLQGESIPSNQGTAGSFLATPAFLPPNPSRKIEP